MPSKGTKRQVSVIFYWEMTSRHVAMLCLVAGLTIQKRQIFPRDFSKSTLADSLPWCGVGWGSP